jgi:hypothetical protein
MEKLNKIIEKHSMAKSIFLHLLPGVLVGLGYFLLAPIVKQHGFPTVMALIVSGIFILLPVELGFLLYQSKKKGDEFFGGIIKYRKPLKTGQYFLWTAVIFILSGLLFKAFGFTSEFLMNFFRSKNRVIIEKITRFMYQYISNDTTTIIAPNMPAKISTHTIFCPSFSASIPATHF